MLHSSETAFFLLQCKGTLCIILQTLLWRCDTRAFQIQEKVEIFWKLSFFLFQMWFCISSQNTVNVAVCWFTSVAELKCSRCKGETGFLVFFKRIGSKTDDKCVPSKSAQNQYILLNQRGMSFWNSPHPNLPSYDSW